MQQGILAHSSHAEAQGLAGLRPLSSHPHPHLPSPELLDRMEISEKS